MLKTAAAAALTILTCLMSAATAPAQGIVDNTGSPQNGATPVNSGITLAQSFTTGSDGTSLNTIMPNLFFTAGGGGFQLALFSDDSGSVGSQITALSGTATPAAFSSPAYTADSPFALNPMTTYWWVASATVGDIYVDYTYVPGVQTTDGWSINNGFANNQGDGWSYGGANGPQLLFAINATLTPAPEPSSLALTALGLGAGAVFLRRRQVR